MRGTHFPNRGAPRLSVTVDGWRTCGNRGTAGADSVPGREEEANSTRRRGLTPEGGKYILTTGTVLVSRGVRDPAVKTTTRLSAPERREAILAAVRRLFADKGFHGTTTRELAEAAGVSEALLFKHFPTKEALFAAMQASSCSERDSAEFQRLLALEPSTSTLVLLVHFLFFKMVLGRPRRQVEGEAGEECTLHRLMLRSLMEDGEFARLFLQRVASCWVPKMEECLRAAAAAGDLADESVAPSLRAWFVHHLAVMLTIHLQPPTPAVDYAVSREKLVEQAVRFALRGLGLEEKAVRRHYNPKAFALLSG
jgi:AcrR family transcriptional regulator